MIHVRAIARQGAIRTSQLLGLHVQRRRHRTPLVEGLCGLLNNSSHSCTDRVAALCLLRGTQAMLRAGVAPSGQLLQDVMALGVSGEGKHFVEFGAGHPWHLSNTGILATKFGWGGTRAEPNPDFFKLHDQEKLPDVTTSMVFIGADEGNVDFLPLGELGTRFDLSQGDRHRRSRRKLAKTVRAMTVQSQSPRTFMAAKGVPKEFGFLSVDTEGSEIEIMRTFPFEEFSFDFACIEHNFDEEKRSLLTAIMCSKGYATVLSECSGWDAWFIRNQRMAELRVDFGLASSI